MDVSVNTVFLKGMLFSLQVGKDAWKREGKTQPVRIDLSVGDVNSIADAAASDDVSKGLDYGDLYKKIQSNLDDRHDYSDALEVARQALKFDSPLDARVNVDVTLCKAALGAEGGLRYSFGRSGGREDLVYFKSLQILGIRCTCIIGVNSHERRNKQPVLVNLTFRVAMETVPTLCEDWMAGKRVLDIIDTMVKRVEESSYRTIEALANAICKDVILEYRVLDIEASVEKPYAIPSISAAGVQIRRRRSFYIGSGVMI